MKRNVMIDLETMGLAANAAIISIGACLFSKDRILAEFHTAISLKDCELLGLSTTPSTVKWWSEQSEEARSSWNRPEAPTLIEALTSFSEWLKRDVSTHSGEIIPWGNGADFDLTILGSAHAVVGADLPWKYWNHRCFRTMKSVFPTEFERVGTYHNALDDAITQAKHLQAICAKHNIDIF